MSNSQPTDGQLGLATGTTRPGYRIDGTTDHETTFFKYRPKAYGTGGGAGEPLLKDWNFSMGEPALFGSATRPDRVVGFGYNIGSGGGLLEDTGDASFGLTFEDYYNASGTIRQFEFYLQSIWAGTTNQVRPFHVNVSYPTLASNTRPNIGTSVRYGPTGRYSFEYLDSGGGNTQYFSMFASNFVFSNGGRLYFANNAAAIVAEDNPLTTTIPLIKLDTSNRVQLGQAGNSTAFPDNAIFTAAGKTITFTKGGAAATSGTFVCNGATNVTITTTAASANMVFLCGLNTVGGTVGNTPHITTISAGTSFTVAGTALDTSTYNWAIINLA